MAKVISILIFVVTLLNVALPALDEPSEGLSAFATVVEAGLDQDDVVSGSHDHPVHNDCHHKPGNGHACHLGHCSFIVTSDFLLNDVRVTLGKLSTDIPRPHDFRLFDISRPPQA